MPSLEKLCPLRKVPMGLMPDLQGDDFYGLATLGTSVWSLAEVTSHCLCLLLPGRPLQSPDVGHRVQSGARPGPGRAGGQGSGLILPPPWRQTAASWLQPSSLGRLASPGLALPASPSPSCPAPLSRPARTSVCSWGAWLRPWPAPKRTSPQRPGPSAAGLPCPVRVRRGT